MPDPLADRACRGVVVNVGGLHSPFSGTTGHSYLQTLLPPVLRAIRDHGLSVDAVCGNIDADQAEWLRTQTDHGAHIGVLPPAEFEAALRSARLLIPSPGSTTLLQANRCAIPVSAGHAVLLDVRLLHRSGLNSDQYARIGLNVRYVAPGGVRMRDHTPPELDPISGTGW